MKKKSKFAYSMYNHMQYIRELGKKFKVFK